MNVSILKNTILYAPNIHTGGGLVLLRSLLVEWPSDTPLILFLDVRARFELAIPKKAIVFWVNATVASRLSAELDLKKSVGSGDLVLCFHGLPPIFLRRGRICVFLQNRLYIDKVNIFKYKLKTLIRLVMERTIFLTLHSKVNEYIVQTQSMRRMLIEWQRKRFKILPIVRMLPFIKEKILADYSKCNVNWDFIYVSDGESHKNHKNLLEAWKILSAQGIRPSLALTLGSRDEKIWQDFVEANENYDLRISNLNNISHEKVISLYLKSGALIFPSIVESFGLPLIEATQVGLPIIASELDYVRDVCDPVQTFDPNSPTSIARAVKRFLEVADCKGELNTPTQFWNTLLNNK